MEQERILAEAWKPIAALFQSDVQDGMHYRLYVPKELEQGKKYPLVLFLHGAGERGSDNVAQLTAYEGALIWVREQLDGTGEKCFVRAPQIPETSSGWQEKELLAVSNILDRVMEAHPVDENRLYLTGISLGGGGCWRMNFMYPERFAATVPVCSAGGFQNRKINPVAIEQAAGGFYGKKLWLFHAADDVVVSPESSRCLAKALEQRGEVKGVDFHFTEYPAEMGWNHGCWPPTYDNQTMRRWLFQQTLAPEHTAK